MHIILRRVAENPDGTFGVLLLDNTPFAVTLEDRWKGNASNISCIPSGDYKAVRCRYSKEYDYQDSPKFGDTFVIENVPGRSKILFHKGNRDEDTRGCILVAEQFGKLWNNTAILQSKEGFDEFMALMQDVNEFYFTILDTHK